MFKIAICDDSKAYIQYMVNLISGLGIGNLEIFEYTSGRQLLQDLKKMHDIIILDVQLGDSNGNQVAEKIRAVNRDTILVMCSGVVSPTPMAFEVDAYRYLMKSDSESAIKRILKEVFDEAERRFTCDCLFANTENAQVRVKIDDIMYISKIKYGSEIHVAPNTPYSKSSQLTLKGRLDDLYETMKNYGFEYAHSSYIVNCKWIREKKRDSVEFYDGEILPVSRNMRKRLENRLANSLAEKYP